MSALPLWLLLPVLWLMRIWSSWSSSSVSTLWCLPRRSVAWALPSGIALCALSLLFPTIAHAQPDPGFPSSAQGEVIEGSTLGETYEVLPASPAPRGAWEAARRTWEAAQIAARDADPPPAATGVVISEFRLSGPGGATDEFIELTNVTASAIDLSGWTLTAGTTTTALSSLDFMGKSIPARGHLLLTNSGAYSLTGYATGDVLYTGDIAPTSTLTLSDASSNVVDSIGNLWAIAAPANSTNQYAYVRRSDTGLPADSGTDSADFNLVDTSATVSTTDVTGVGPLTAARLGAPGPQNIASPIQRNGSVTLTPLTIGTSVAPTVRMVSRGSSIDPLGRMGLRRTFTNNTGATITSLRFRIVGGTTGTSTTASGVADLRPISSAGVRYYASDGVTILQATVPVPMQSPSLPTEAPLTASSGNNGKGGGVGSSFLVTLPSGGLAPGASVGVEFLFGIVTDGSYRILVDSEVVTAPLPTPTPEPTATPTPTATPQPTLSPLDARVRVGNDGDWVGENDLDVTGASGFVSQSAQAGTTASFFASVVRRSAPVGPSARLKVPNYPDFVAAGGEAHFFVGTTDQEITSALTSATGWATSIALNEDTLVRVEIAMPTTARPASWLSLVIQTQDEGSGDTPILDAVRMRAVVAPRAIPDLSIRESNPVPPRTDPDAGWVGQDIISSVSENGWFVNQSLAMGANTNAPIRYDVRVKNVGNLAGAFALSLSAPPQGWTHSLVATEGEALTVQAPDHWLLPSLAPGQFLELLLIVQPVGNIDTVPPCVVDIQAKSDSAHDRVGLNLEVQHIDHLEYTLDPGEDGRGANWLVVPATGIAVPQGRVLGMRVIRSNEDAPWPDDPFKPEWRRGDDSFVGDKVWLHFPEATPDGDAGEEVQADCATGLRTLIRVLPDPEAE